MNGGQDALPFNSTDGVEKQHGTLTANSRYDRSLPTTDDDADGTEIHVVETDGGTFRPTPMEMTMSRLATGRPRESGPGIPV